MTGAFPHPESPRSVTVAVWLALVALAVQAANLALGYADAPFIVIWRLALPALALVALIQRRRWALVLFVVAVVDDVRGLPAAPPEWAAIGLRLAALGFLLTVSSRRWFRPRPLPHPSKPSALRRRRVGIAVILSLQISLIVFLAERLAVDRVAGEWAFLAALFVLPAMFALGFAALFMRGEGGVRRARMAAVGLAVTAPLLARLLAPVAVPFVERRYEAELQRLSEAFEEKRQREYEARRAKNEQAARARFEALPPETQQAIVTANKRYAAETLELQIQALRTLSDSPQMVKAAGDWYIILENLHGVRLYGMNRTAEVRQAFESWAQTNLVGQAVDIRLPEDFEDRYRPGWRVKWSQQHGGVMDNRGHQFGEVDGLVFLDKHLVNLDYCATGQRARLLDYQSAYTRGEL